MVTVRSGIALSSGFGGRLLMFEVQGEGSIVRPAILPVLVFPGAVHQGSQGAETGGDNALSRQR